MSEDKNTPTEIVQGAPTQIIRPDTATEAEPATTITPQPNLAEPQEPMNPAEPEATMPIGEAPIEPDDDDSLPLSEGYDGIDDDTESVTWTASEFVAHHKTASWYLALTATTVVIAALVYLLTRDILSVAVIVVGAIVLGIYAGRQPRQLQYNLGSKGLSIGSKTFSYADFRSFSIIPEGAFSSIVFMPMKRFMPLISIYYAPEDEARIVELLGNALPMEERKSDLVDRLFYLIRF